MSFSEQFDATKLDSPVNPELDQVLVAEDDPVFRHVLQNWLQKWNYCVTAVENGVDAWNLLQTEKAPKMVIVDWMMPEMDGLELCRRIRNLKLAPYRYILLLTAKDNKQDVVTGLEAGADDYLTKPFNVDELRARVRTGRRILQLQDALLQAKDALQFEAAHDPLTGLYNRGAIMDFLQREGQRHVRTREPLGVIMADLDYFKRVNDTYGHLMGDIVLKESARRFMTVMRSYDGVGRYGGEEFLIVVPGCNLADLVASGERLRNCMAEQPIQAEEIPVPVTLSVGVASALLVGTDALNYETLLRAADAALYRAKANGRNRVECATFARATAQGMV